jgi:hypothetical protein
MHLPVCHEQARSAGLRTVRHTTARTFGSCARARARAHSLSSSMSSSLSSCLTDQANAPHLQSTPAISSHDRHRRRRPARDDATGAWILRWPKAMRRPVIALTAAHSSTTAGEDAGCPPLRRRADPEEADEAAAPRPWLPAQRKRTRKHEVEESDPSSFAATTEEHAEETPAAVAAGKEVPVAPPRRRTRPRRTS